MDHQSSAQTVLRGHNQPSGRRIPTGIGANVVTTTQRVLNAHAQSKTRTQFLYLLAFGFVPSSFVFFSVVSVRLLPVAGFDPGWSREMSFLLVTRPISESIDVVLFVRPTISCAILKSNYASALDVASSSCHASTSVRNLDFGEVEK
mmetsp:Transcript_29706/g.60704  ORF Transcript_29706/g.60704 Transcript_29706/m.60704 type:complete len:147 (-) Transcript_29706:67-507(-)